MNAGGVAKACKSCGHSLEFTLDYDSGKRVSNTLVTYLRDGDNSAKAGLIPDGHEGTKVILM